MADRSPHALTLAHVRSPRNCSDCYGSCHRGVVSTFTTSTDAAACGSDVHGAADFRRKGSRMHCASYSQQRGNTAFRYRRTG
jgi:hypothetical protein